MSPPDTPSSPATSLIDNPEMFRAAFLAMRPHYENLPIAVCYPVTVDVAAAAATILAAAPRVMALRPRIALLPEFDMLNVDLMESFAQAAAYAHAIYLSATAGTVTLGALRQEMVEHRSKLFDFAQTLQRWGLFDADPIEPMRVETGPLDPAHDLFALSRVFRSAWSRIENKCPLELADLDHADALAQRYIIAYTEREQPSPEPVRAGRDRQRAFTRAMVSYQEVQSALDYLLRFQGNQLTPSVYAGPGSPPRPQNNQDKPSTPARRGT